MKEFENQENGEKMSWKRFVSKLIQPDAPGLRYNLDTFNDNLSVQSWLSSIFEISRRSSESKSLV